MEMAKKAYEKINDIESTMQYYLTPPPSNAVAENTGSRNARM